MDNSTLQTVSVGHHVYGTHFMLSNPLSLDLLTPLDRAEPHGTQVTVEIGGHILIIFTGSANHDRRPWGKWAVTEKTDPLLAEIDQPALHLPCILAGMLQGDFSVTLVAGKVSLFL